MQTSEQLTLLITLIFCFKEAKKVFIYCKIKFAFCHPLAESRFKKYRSLHSNTCSAVRNKLYKNTLGMYSCNKFNIKLLIDHLKIYIFRYSD